MIDTTRLAAAFLEDLIAQLEDEVECIESVSSVLGIIWTMHANGKRCESLQIVTEESWFDLDAETVSALSQIEAEAMREVNLALPLIEAGGFRKYFTR